ncbi:MAG: AAA family ATPase [Burkholderiales bacterium]|nr:AAA family ATPase [Burkholderiales bacterium]
MRLKNLEINGFKSFAKKTVLEFQHPVVSIVGPNGSGKSNVVEALRFVLGEQSMKSMRGSQGADLIFKGSKNLPKSSRASVTIYFDNSDNVFKLSNETGENLNLNYDVISISREVFSDGLNKYILNGSEVRLKDINNLLSSVNIGSSGHHIISQGEADRILNASPKDRREMVEDALGLKIYQYKIKEAGRKLERTANNMKEVSLLRRENAPHLNFLRKQVDKFEKAKEMQVSLLSLYNEYLKKESIYLENEKQNLSNEKNKIVAELESIKDKIESVEEENIIESEKEKQLKDLERKVNEIRHVKGEIERKLGRIEGMIEMEERREKKAPAIVVKNPEEIKAIFDEIAEEIEVAIVEENVSEIKFILLRIKDVLQKFNQTEEKTENHSINSEILELKNDQQRILSEMQNITNEENKIFESIQVLRGQIREEKEILHTKEKERFNFRVRNQELTSHLEIISVKEYNLSKQQESFENELREGSILIGNDILNYKNFEASLEVDRGLQEELKRKIERIKIKLEDVGLGGGADVLKEYEEVSQRDSFLAKEMEDLAKSIESLRLLIADLKEKIDIEFKEGIKKINIEFSKFFSLMFGGGEGYLSVVTENKKKKNNEESFETTRDDSGESDIIFEQGIEINVTLPHKKVKELNALSGGERSLTSIALLFAMSQVNPPPFLVLDETDAALDEANSRKYGDMLEKLSHHSQLVVVTHNRETMSRAGILYGVTVGADGASKLLSVKLDEAKAIAK